MAITSQNIVAGKPNGCCLGAIVGKTMGLGTNAWLVEDSFMKNVYTAFSFGANTVGFATLK